MVKFIRLNLINYFIEKDEYGEPVRCRAFRYDEIIQTKFIEGFREERYQLMIMDLKIGMVRF